MVASNKQNQAQRVVYSSFWLSKTLYTHQALKQKSEDEFFTNSKPCPVRNASKVLRDVETFSKRLNFCTTPHVVEEQKG